MSTRQTTRRMIDQWLFAAQPIFIAMMTLTAHFATLKRARLLVHRMREKEWQNRSKGYKTIFENRATGTKQFYTL